MNIPDNLLCTSTHEYMRACDDYFYVGITDLFLQKLGGDVIFIELPQVGDIYSKKEVFATIESNSAASEIYMPVMAKIIEINSKFSYGYDDINLEPLSDGWILKVKPLYFEADRFHLIDYNDYKQEYGN